MKLTNYLMPVALAGAMLISFGCEKEPLVAETITQTESSTFEVYKNSDEFQKIGKEYFEDLQRKETALSKNFHAKITKDDLEALKTVGGNAHISMLLKEYHKQRAEYIREARIAVDNPSIQSISDEINSLIAYDKKTAEALYNEYKNVLIKSEYGVKPIADPYTSVSLNKNGLFQIKDKLYQVTKESVKVVSNYTQHFDLNQLEGISQSNAELNIEVRVNKSHLDCQNKGKRSQNETGPLPNVFSINNTPIYALTWGAGISVLNNYSFMNVTSWFKDINDPYSWFVPWPSYRLRFWGETEARSIPSNSQCPTIYGSHSNDQNDVFATNHIYTPLIQDQYCYSHHYKKIRCNGNGILVFGLGIEAGGFIAVSY